MLKTSAFGKRCTAAVLAASLMIATVAHADIEAARAALEDNDYAAAVDALDAILQQRPDDIEARFLKGLALARGGDVDAAIPVFERLAQRRPDMAEAWNNLGVLRARENELQGALDALRQSVQIDPEQGPTQENLADVYVTLARDAYRLAGELEAENDIARAKSRQLNAIINSGSSAVTGAAPDNGRSADEVAAAPQTSSDVGAADAAAPAASESAAVADSEELLPVEAGSAGAGDAEQSQASAGRAARDTGDAVPARDQIRAALQAWARAWSAQDLQAYLGAYSDNFRPHGDRSLSDWAQWRRQRVRAPAHIEITLSNMNIQVKSAGHAVAAFDQHYMANTYQDREHKRVELQREDGGWRIVEES